ncbi:hypothetical protein ACFSTI_17425 [Rhizorhabdus histidinilytica]
MRVVVVTGCSSGIGLETALAFAAAGTRSSRRCAIRCAPQRCGPRLKRARSTS